MTKVLTSTNQIGHTKIFVPENLLIYTLANARQNAPHQIFLTAFHPTSYEPVFSTNHKEALLAAADLIDILPDAKDTIQAWLFEIANHFKTSFPDFSSIAIELLELEHYTPRRDNKTYQVTSPDSNTFIVSIEDKEIAVCSSYEGEPVPAELRANTICIALNNTNTGIDKAMTSTLYKIITILDQLEIPSEVKTANGLKPIPLDERVVTAIRRAYTGMIYPT